MKTVMILFKNGQSARVDYFGTLADLNIKLVCNGLSENDILTIVFL